ncbi:MAG: hypothetical protein ACP5I6_03575 [Caldisphaera sp.]|jgi:hypothetical protein|nr:hypothetical protein [Caldisphaera sp.]PMP60988.1 MAG: hypothetical protein C0201_01365 [Caldisphaera sp.]
MKAKIIQKGRLAYITTENGQKAVIPWDNLCNIIKRFGLVPILENDVKLDCPKLDINEFNNENEVDYDLESEESEEES